MSMMGSMRLLGLAVAMAAFVAAPASACEKHAKQAAAACVTGGATCESKTADGAASFDCPFTGLALFALQSTLASPEAEHAVAEGAVCEKSGTCALTAAATESTADGHVAAAFAVGSKAPACESKLADAACDGEGPCPLKAGGVAAALDSNFAQVVMALDSKCPLATAAETCDGEKACAMQTAALEKTGACCEEMAAVETAALEVAADICPITGLEGECPLEAAKAAACDAGACDGTGNAVDSATPAVGGKDLVATAIEAGSFGTFLMAAKAAGMLDELRALDGVTMLVPSNEAFAALTTDEWMGLLEDEALLRSVLRQHIIQGSLAASQIAAGSDVTNVVGRHLAVSTCPKNGTRVGEAWITSPDIAASNGTIHVVDRVLLSGDAPDMVAKASMEQL